MPNHMHGIFVIENGNNERADARAVPMISDIICSFTSKTVVDYVGYIKSNNLNLSGKIWQRSFYDYVIRS